MNIQSFKIRAARVPMSEPHKTSSAIINVCPVVTISAQTDEGVRGDGIIFTYADVFLKAVHTLATSIAPMLEGQELNPTANTDMLHDRFKLLGTQGMMGMVLSGFDMALWDAKARAEGKALSSLLGGATLPVVPYANVGFDGVKGSAEGAGKFAAIGFKAVKAKIGYETIADDLAVIRAMREAVGPNVELMVDYNQSLSIDEARTRLHALESEGLAWVEEPILSHDFKNYAALQKGTTTPLQAGENWWGPADFQTAFDLGTSGLIMPDAQKCGGVTGWMRIAKIAEQNNAKVSSHLWPEVSAQLLSVTPTAHWLEYADWFNPVIREPLKIENGIAIFDHVIGSGVELNDEALAIYAA